jgi:hypothetical protein
MDPLVGFSQVFVRVAEVGEFEEKDCGESGRQQ